MVKAKARGLQGQGQRSSRPSPRPQDFVLEVSSRSRPVFKDPHPWAFYRAMLRREWLCHVVCLSITLKFNALMTPLVRLCMKYCIYGIDYSILYLLTILKNETSYCQILKPRPMQCIVEAKAKARGLQGQGHKILSSRLGLASISV